MDHDFEQFIHSISYNKNDIGVAFTLPDVGPIRLLTPQPSSTGWSVLRIEENRINTASHGHNYLI